MDVVSTSFCPIDVTPFAGVWIEITMLDEVYKLASVTPFAGVWIEIGFIFSSILVD